MKQTFGMSRNGNLAEAARALIKPQFIMLMSNQKQFEQHVQELEKLFPGVPSIGCIGMSYDTRVVEDGVGLIAFSEGVNATANVLEQEKLAPAGKTQYVLTFVREMTPACLPQSIWR